MTIRVMVVDDSAAVRRAVTAVVDAEDDLEVVAAAADGREALAAVAGAAPDVVSLDVEMPVMDGLATLRELRLRWPRLPVVMYSSITRRGAETTLEALAAGAVDFAAKPGRVHARDEVAGHVRTSLVPLLRLWGTRDALTKRPRRPVADDGVGRPAPARPPAPRPARRPVDLVVVGASTGGPDALATVVAELPGDLRVPVLVVQHMPPVFTQLLATRLDRLGPARVSEAVDGEPARPGHVYLAPGGRHLEVHATAAGLELALTDGPPENSCRPAVDVLFRSALEATHGRLAAVVLTGMGQDGRVAAAALAAAGAPVVAQDEATSVVWGMPGYVARDGSAGRVVPLDEVAGAIVDLAGRVPVGVTR